MKRVLLNPTVLALTLPLILTGVVSAQRTIPYAPTPYGPGFRPQLSPYLNFLRGGNPAANYFLGTRPEIQRRSNVNLFNRQFRQIETDLTFQGSAIASTERADIFTPLPGTGHPTAFSNVGTYFGTPTPRVNRPPLPGPAPRGSTPGNQ
jgi:hypothetical protein